AHGWHNIRNPNFVAQDEIEYKSDARRYEAGSQNLLGVVGLRAALELLSELGVENIGRDLLRKRGWVVPALEEKGYTVLNGNASPETAGPMMTFFKRGADMAVLHENLTANNVVASLRGDRRNQS